MRSRLPVILVWLVLFLLPQGDLDGQTQGPTRAGAVSEVMGSRLSYLDDDLPFEACSVYEALNEPADFPETIRSPVIRGMLLGTPGSCVAPDTATYPGIMVIESLVFDPPTAEVFLRGRRTDLSWREEYLLINRGGDIWYIYEARIHSMGASWSSGRP